MKVIHARNVHQALPKALLQLRQSGVPRDSRNGPVRLFKEPVTTVYSFPRERVLFWAERDCNPFFHLYESLWMLGGRNDVKGVAAYVPRMATFSDDGKTLHGAYGFRWREHFGYDQLPKIIKALKANPDDRRQVLSMWDAHVDLGREGKDFPCNLQALFSINVYGALDMMVTNRSNDIVWGAYGANAVHFSFLQEYVAAAIGVAVGQYRQVSNNFHGYLATLAPVESLADLAVGLVTRDDWMRFCPYDNGSVEPYPLISGPIDAWHADLEAYLQGGSVVYNDPFFNNVAQPMHNAYTAYKRCAGEERYKRALHHINLIQASDWRLACAEWIERRHHKFLHDNDDGVQS